MPHEGADYAARCGEAPRRTSQAEIRRQARNHPRDRGSAIAWRPVGKRRVHAAREQQGFIEGRIKEIEQRLADAQVIDPASLPSTGKVVFGATVELAPVDGGPEVSYQIVGDDEADIRQGQVSINSPIARALIGRSAGDEVAVAAPGGTRSFEVLNVRLS